METKNIELILNNYDASIRLDFDQKSVILDDSRILMVIAGAGSGKTTTIAAKIKFLVDIKRVNPNDILVISLTNKAVKELHDIIVDGLNINACVCTFHKLAYEILKQNDMRYRIISKQKDIILKLINEDGETRKIIRYILKDKSIREKSKHIGEYKEIILQLVLSNIKLLKTLNKSFSTLNKNENRYFKYLSRIYDKYNNFLESKYLLDFDDVINNSIQCDVNLKYKYIIVDEYQDISQNRLQLLKKLMNVSGAKLVLVGDDFQTIFSFAGSEIRNFLTFKKDNSFKIVKITKTYRNSQQLIDVAGSFVMKNKSLISKKLISNKSIPYPIKIYGYSNNFNDVFERIVIELIQKYGMNKKILVLGRYKSDINKLNNANFIIKENRIIYKKYSMLIIDYMTIHSSKGLGYDNVILINLEVGMHGFPTSIVNDRFTEQIIGYKSDIEEERRLLYVALTRTKNMFYGITKKGNESDFVRELAQYKQVLVDYDLKMK